jgi:type I restriction enzyme S subunit
MSGTGITMHPSVKNLESIVKRVRDVLRKGDGITDMDSMAHCVLFTAARMLDTATATKLNVPYTWDSVISKVLAKDINGADKAFKDILEVLDSKFNTNEFTWKLKVQDDFEKIVKLFNELDIHEVAKHTDVLGFIYEQHISTGSGGGRDLGKFYTDRQITRYLTKLLGSDITAGRPDSMCDATMGTGGFILSYIEYVTKMCPEVKWDDYDLAGGDIDDKVAAIARLNVFLRTGKLFPMIRKRNTLKNDIGDSSDKRKTFKRLLMNIPFGVKGLTLADDCCERIKEIVKVGTKSEPLFMTLTCQLLDEGGKAAVIVPDGVLDNCSKQHEIFRKYLLENFKVLRIIKMRGKFFMNTGIQPSVIVFERSGKTDVVEFWDVEKVASGELVETCMLKVAREKFDGSYSFDMRRYQEAKSVGNLAGFPMVKLSDVSTANNGKILAMIDIQGNPGIYPIMSGGRSYCGNYNTFNRDGNQITISKTGSSSGFIGWHNQKFWAADCFTLNVNDSCNIKFLYYILMTKQDIIYKEYQRRGVMPHCYWSDISEICFPLPPLPIQQEIVESLDLIYNNAKTAKLAASSIKAQMAAVMRSVGARGYEKKKLGEVFIVKGGKAINKENLTGTKFPYYGCNGVNGYVDEYLFEGEYIICAQDGSIGSVYMVNEKFYPSNHTHIITTKDANILNNKFASYYLKMCVDWKPLITSIIPKVTQGKLLEIPILTPPLPIQQEVLTILNEMETELKTMEQMVARAEQRAKYILDGYLSSQKVEPEVVHEVVEPVTPVNEVVEASVAPVTPPKPKKTIIRLKKTDPVV